jgi:hypothetical protein
MSKPDDEPRGSRARGFALAGLVGLALVVLATLGTLPILWPVALVVFGVAALIGRVVPRAHGWIAGGGLALAAVGALVAVAGLVDEDDPWADLVIAIWVIVLAAVGCAWFGGVLLGRRWRRRAKPLPLAPEP